MSLPQRILLAIGKPERVPSRAFAKAVSIARRSGGTVELFHAIAEPVVSLTVSGRRHRQDLHKAMDDFRARRTALLERAARRARKLGVEAIVHCEWDFPAHEAIVRRARATRADVVVVESARRMPGAHFFVSHADWELIRSCETPLLLVRAARVYRGGAVIAAVDPFHVREKPAALDRRLLAAARDFAEGFAGTLHAVHAYLPLSYFTPTIPGDVASNWIPADVENRRREKIENAFARMAQAAKIPPVRRHLRVGDPADEIVRVANSTRAALVVMGAVSRSGLNRLLVGSTAQRALNKMPCDVLVIKPAGFRSRVPAA